MYIESVELKNFRNYASAGIQFHPGINLFYGNNAQGKTNILEAVYLCGTTKSHRGNKDREIIRFQEEEAHIRMMVQKEYRTCRIDMHLKKNKPKGIAINGIPIKKAKELFGTTNLIFFSPEDLHLIKNGPGSRRRFLDLELCQLDQVYLAQLSSYQHILNQRNRLLKEIRHAPKMADTLDVWDLQLVQYGERILRMRRKFLEELNETIGKIHQRLTGGMEQLSLTYEPNVGEEAFARNLFECRERDLKLQTTTAGPHRDDFCVTVNGMDLRKFGSQGQQRTAALSLKLSEIVLVKEKIQDTPILLLDDVLSELDKNRQKYLLEYIENIQTLITCTGQEDFLENKFQIHKIFYVEDGKVCLANG